jgi:hypothetical protein
LQGYEREKGRGRERKEEGEPTGLAPAALFLTGVDDHHGRRRCRLCGEEKGGGREK